MFGLDGRPGGAAGKSGVTVQCLNRLFTSRESIERGKNGGAFASQAITMGSGKNGAFASQAIAIGRVENGMCALVTLVLELGHQRGK